MIVLIGIVAFVLIGIVGGLLLLSRGHRRLPYAALFLGFAVFMFCILQYDNGWGKEKREVEEQIAQCIIGGGDPQFLIDNANQEAKFYGCVER